MGGEQPEIFIRLNDPEKIRRIVYGEIKYSNGYVTKAKQKHEREVKILRKFFTDPFDDGARWDYVERYFLGDDVLREAESIAEEKVDFSRFVDKENHIPLTTLIRGTELHSFLMKTFSQLLTILRTWVFRYPIICLQQ